ncbi:transcriptional regulator, XRE family [Hymenobacter roseosalivarius DSM 11622]|uniref:Transcriptional regulator, XRE family n=1 Tax=Hymenobacter roseosalivarius DSM 11622 TaxID=645990 RepID=A0A1W1W104_9BACT|nr:helix-turn-helix transcriptional regulator [Hymenobacter roseosalivarius]SMB98784.1 transcriptional regulator, XRE family [Hymenobacter roseosalivarius DSM 11622]
MVERIRQILQTRQLSPTQFADVLGLARPIISHVLSGRNKPSLEVVQKIIAAFPDLSLPWLLSGQGPMLATAAATLTAAVAPGLMPVAEPKRAKRPATLDSDPLAASPAAPTLPLPAAEPPRVVTPATSAAMPVEAPRTAPLSLEPALPNAAASAAVSNTASQGATMPAQSPSAASDMLSAFGEPGKTIRRIVIFYHDGTFSAYQPEMMG